MVSSPLIRPYFLRGGGIGGGTLNSHDIIDPFCIDSTHLHQGFLQAPSGGFKQFPCSSLVWGRTHFDISSTTRLNHLGCISKPDTKYDQLCLSLSEMFIYFVMFDIF